MTWVIAHRCNTVEAVERAIATGADMLELDVRRTRAGKLVAVHDPVETRGDAPLLADLVALARGRVPLDVELKEDGYVADALDLLHGLDGLVVTSFIDAVVAQAAPFVRTGLLVSAPASRERLAACGAHFVAPTLSALTSGPALVWTINDDVEISTLLHDDRVAGVITDAPARALALRDGLSGQA
jgi:glycerophosphoryl diester phosphodiesterase